MEEGAPSGNVSSRFFVLTFIQDALLIMDEVLDMLKLLDYESKFCRQKQDPLGWETSAFNCILIIARRGFKPLSRSFFAAPTPNASEQFIYFVQLVTWLLAINNHQVTGWNKYDDPTTASQNVSKVLAPLIFEVLELKKLGIELDMPPTKLKTGNGDGVCIVLQRLCQISLQQRFRFKKPVIKDDGGMDGGDAGGEIDGDSDGGQDIADQAQADISSEEDIADFGNFNQGAAQEEQDPNNAIIESAISREDWIIECDKVAHKLKINKNVGGDGKEWRSHLDQTKKYAENVKQSLPDVRYKLEKLGEDVSRAIERIAKKESLLSKSFQGMTGDYRAHSEHLREIQNNFNATSKNVQDLESELMDINEKLTNYQRRIEDKDQSISDTSPLQKIKKAIGQVKNDIKSIDIRIGVVSNTLLQLKLKERAKQLESASGKDNIAEVVGDDYDLEL